MNKVFTRNIILILSGLFFLAASCTGRKDKAERSGLIPEEDFVEVLTDIHLADGLMIIPDIRQLFQQSDSIRIYMDIVERHGYTMEEMERTIRYYFVKKPKRLISIYDKVLARLTELETYYAQADEAAESNHWKGDTVYFFPSDTGSLVFDHQFESFGYITLNFTLTLYPDDPSVNPRFSAYFCHPDSIETGKRDYYPSFIFIKDGRPHKYSFFRKPSSPSYTHMRGNFVGSDNQLSGIERHLMINDIFLNFLPAAR